MWSLDHASVRVPSLEAASARLTRLFGYAPAPTSGARNHSRLFLSGTYLEVREESVPTADLALWFLRFDDAEATRAALGARGLAVEGPSVYQGVDGGRWQELHLRAPADVPAPVLVKRVYPEEIARNWPPTVPEGPLGRLALDRIVIASSELEATAGFFERLATTAPDGPTPFTHGGRTCIRRDLRLARGGVTLLAREGTRPLIGLGFACASLERLSLHLHRVGVGFERLQWNGREELWLAPDAFFGLELFFAVG